MFGTQNHNVHPLFQTGYTGIDQLAGVDVQTPARRRQHAFYRLIIIKMQKYLYGSWYRIR